MEQDQNDHDPAPPDPRTDARAAVLHLALARPALGDALILGGVEQLAALVSRHLGRAREEAPDLDAHDPHAARLCVEYLSRRVVDAVSIDPDLARAVLGPGGGVLGALLDRLVPGAVLLRPYSTAHDDHLTERALVAVSVALGVDPEAAAEAAMSDPGWLGERCRTAVAELRARTSSSPLVECAVNVVATEEIATIARQVGAPLPDGPTAAWDVPVIRTVGRICRDAVAEFLRAAAQPPASDAMLARHAVVALREVASSAGVGSAQLDPDADAERVSNLGASVAAQVSGTFERAAALSDQVERVRAVLGIPVDADVAASVEAIAGDLAVALAPADAGRRAIEELVRVSEVLLGARPPGWEPTPERVAALGGALVGRARAILASAPTWDPDPGHGDNHARLARAEATLESICACVGADPEEDLPAAVAAVVQREVEHEAALREALGLPDDAPDAEVLAAARRDPEELLDGHLRRRGFHELCLPSTASSQDVAAAVVEARADANAALAALGMNIPGAPLRRLLGELRRALESRATERAGAGRSPLRVADARKLLASLHEALRGEAPAGKFDVDDALREAAEYAARLRCRALAIACEPPGQHLAGALARLERAGAPISDEAGVREIRARVHLLDAVAVLSARGASAEHKLLELDALAERVLDHARLRARHADADSGPARDALAPVAEAALARFVDATSMSDPDLRDAVSRAVGSARRDLLDVVAMLAGDLTDEDREQGVDGLARAARRLAREALEGGRASPPLPDDDLRSRVEALGSFACVVLDSSDPARALDFLNGEISRAARDLEAAADALGLEPDPDATLPALASRVRSRAQAVAAALRELAASVAPLEPGDDACPDAALLRSVPRVAALVGEALGKLSEDAADPIDLVAAAEAMSAAASRAIGGTDADDLRSWAPAAHAVLLRVSLGIADECPSAFASEKRTTCRTHEPLGEDAARELLAAVEQHANWHLALDPILPRGWDLVRLLDDVVLPHALEADEVDAGEYAPRDELRSEHFAEVLSDGLEDQLRGAGASSSPEYWDRRADQASALRDALEVALREI